MKLLQSGTIILLAILLSVLTSYIVLSVSNLYGLTFLTELGFLKVFGIIAVINIIRDRYSDRITQEGDEIYSESFKRIGYRVLELLIGWSTAFLMFYILK